MIERFYLNLDEWEPCYDEFREPKLYRCLGDFNVSNKHWRVELGDFACVFGRNMDTTEAKEVASMLVDAVLDSVQVTGLAKQSRDKIVAWKREQEERKGL